LIIYFDAVINTGEMGVECGDVLSMVQVVTAGGLRHVARGLWSHFVKS